MAESLSKGVSDDLLTRIRRGEYVVGDQLPTEVDLMREYGVGRNTVRAAMQSLRTLGIVEIRPRRGAVVLDSGSRNVLASSAVAALLDKQAVYELYEVRLLLEPAAAERAAVHRTDHHLVAMRRALTHFQVAYETETPVWEADIEFHQAIADASGNRMLVRVLAPVADLLNNARRATGTLPVAVELALHQHDEIMSAIQDRSSERARCAMATHVESGIWALTQLRSEASRSNDPLAPSAEPTALEDQRASHAHGGMRAVAADQAPTRDRRARG